MLLLIDIDGEGNRKKVNFKGSHAEFLISRLEELDRNVVVVVVVEVEVVMERENTTIYAH